MKLKLSNTPTSGRWHASLEDMPERITHYDESPIEALQKLHKNIFSHMDSLQCMLDKIEIVTEVLE